MAMKECIEVCGKFLT